jgi:hypothetical protein
VRWTLHLTVRYNSGAKDASQAVHECGDRCCSSHEHECRPHTARASQRASPRRQQCSLCPGLMQCVRHAGVSPCARRPNASCSRHGGRVHLPCSSHGSGPLCSITSRWSCPSDGLNKTSLASPCRPLGHSRRAALLRGRACPASRLQPSTHWEMNLAAPQQ